MVNFRGVFTWVSGMKTGLGLLIMIGLSAALGSIVAPFDFYQFWGFQLLLLLLLLNMTFCSVRSLAPWLRHCTIRKISRFPSRLDLLLIHTGIIAILLGAMINAYFGQSTEIAILEGSQINSSAVMACRYPFILQLDEFKIDFNPDGSPEQYYSNVTLFENGSVKTKGSISVNHPLQYQGFKFYQQDYGYVIKARHVGDEGKETEDLWAEDSTLSLPGTDRVLHLVQYAPDFDPERGLNQKPGYAVNPHIIFSVLENNKVLRIGAARFDEKINIENNTSVQFTGVEPYSVLKVKSDPGLSLVLAGGIIFISGLILALFPGFIKTKSHQMLPG